jgi:hypothetical protein
MKRCWTLFGTVFCGGEVNMEIGIFGWMGGKEYHWVVCKIRGRLVCGGSGG